MEDMSDTRHLDVFSQSGLTGTGTCRTPEFCCYPGQSVYCETNYSFVCNLNPSNNRYLFCSDSKANLYSCFQSSGHAPEDHGPEELIKYQLNDCRPDFFKFEEGNDEDSISKGERIFYFSADKL